MAKHEPIAREKRMADYEGRVLDVEQNSNFPVMLALSVNNP
jgi:hypothetical protein